jgi:hypothetical protein
VHQFIVEQQRQRRRRFIVVKGSAKWLAWDQGYEAPTDRRGYAPWSLMGDGRHNRCHSHLWHNSHSPQEYADLATQWGLNYSAQDFADPNAGCGNGYAVRKTR